MPLVGDVLADRYRIDGPLGAGGMASVWRARDLRLGRDVAIKVLLPNLSADPATAARFDREARSLAAAAHPSVVAVFDVEPGDPATGREPFYVMELCDGGSLADRLATTPRIPPRDLAPVLEAVAAGLADLHRRGIVHRDVKPHNILFCDGRPKLADFGLAQSEGDGLDALTATGTTIGTLAYLAPEQLSGVPATPASDVYALAVVAFQALTGRLPRPAASVTQVVEARSTPAAKVSDAAPELGTAFDGVLADALSTEPADRPTPEALAGALTAAAARASAGPASAPTAVSLAPTGPTAPTTPVDAPSGWPEARPPARRSGPALAAVTVVVIVLAALLAANELLGDRRGGAERGATATNPPVAGTNVPQPSQQTPPVAQPPVPAPGAAAGLAAVADFETRLDEAVARGLDDEIAGELQEGASQVEALLVAGDLRAARNRAKELERQVERLRGSGDGDDDDEGGVPQEIVDPLLDAARALHEAIPQR